MIFEENKITEKIGVKLGFIFSYFVFTTILFYAMVFLNKLPMNWNYGYIMGVTLSITFIGVLVKRALK